MTTNGPVDLVRLTDDENGVVVRVTGPTTVNGPFWDGCFEADITVTSGFANGRLTEVFLLPEDLDDWEAALDRLSAGQEVEWMDDGRNPEIRIALQGPYGTPHGPLDAIEVTVRDAAASLTSATVLVRLPDGWIDAQRRQLALVRTVWPWEPR
ncbi:DUF5959 family protein [Streptomyces sp. CB01881]|uniref:DUF5959 family protein n=1 Tax=Streptomyces sp. CB01881 TaxID=2078691 RepID=UPI0011DFF380|nr:DUF5959 family protein [Streptomyces sp. CB01881]TYC74605.1 hypothetical protein EH183_22285 [Streptomyces sp. CB01881]